jgi:WD40 repeat protein
MQCLVAISDGSLYRIGWNSSHSEHTRNRIFLEPRQFANSVFSHCGSFLATFDFMNQLLLYEVYPDRVPHVAHVTLPAYGILKTNAGMAFLPDNKTLAVISDTSDDDDTVVRLLAVDPSSQYLATAFSNGSVRLWTL